MTSPLAVALAAARQSRRLHAYAPSEPPADPYQVQAEVARLVGAQAAGWKTGFGPDRTPIAGPIFDCDMVADGASYTLAPGETVLVEVELAIRLGRDLPGGPAYGVEDVLAATAEMLVGIELIGTRYANADAAPFTARLADNLNNGAFVAGGATRAFAGLDRRALPLRLWIDGACVADHPGLHPDGDPLTGVAAWASAQADRLGGLRAGQVITTGSLNRPVPLRAAAIIAAELEGVGRVGLRLTE